MVRPEEAFLAQVNLDWEECRSRKVLTSEMARFATMHLDRMDEDGILLGLHPFAFAAKASSDDTPNFHEAMNGPDSEGFYKAMRVEIEQLTLMDSWEIVPRTVPESRGKTILDSIWAFRRKRFPDGSVRKLKARLCVRGDQQIEGVDFFDTFSPVVAWSTVRLLLILSVVLGLCTKQVDYTNAFVHAPLEDEIYMEMPRLFGQHGYVCKLKKSVYGLRQSPLNFFLTLKQGLIDRGFTPSQHDPCLFKAQDVICWVYVDDCLFFTRNSTSIDRIIESLRKPEPTRFLLTEEDDVAGFLGILMERRDDGSIELRQTGLINRIIAATNLQDASAKPTPATPTPLGKDSEGAPCEESWKYSSIVGMLMYLASNARPDIAFAVHQCA
eukprot:Pompholyxophrys_punicea_v1_NODE_136_length_3267_cov_3.636364.p1 type:complete len:383 gc:universal NODE_136_length_3267_cov_3.636364:1948-800(-)